MKRLIVLVIFTVSLEMSAQDTLVTHPKYRELFANGAFRDDLYKIKAADFDKMYTKGKMYKILIVYAEPLTPSREELITFRGLIDLCMPSSPLEIYNRLQPNRPSFTGKENLETFVFDEKYIFRKEAVGTYNSAWGLLILNGPIYTVKTFGVSAHNSGKDGYITRKYKYTLQQTMKIENYVSSQDPHETESKIRFKARMKINFRECDDIVQKVEADTPGYGMPDLLKMILEYNEYIRNTDQEYWEASVYPKVKFFRK